jgi:hypothetical protein
MEATQEELGSATAALVPIVIPDDRIYHLFVTPETDLRSPLAHSVRAAAKVLVQPAIAVVAARHTPPCGAGATGKDVWDELPENIRLALTRAKPDESPSGGTASLFPTDELLAPQERKDLCAIASRRSHAHQKTIGPHRSSYEIFAARFEPEPVGRRKQLPGKNFVEQLLALSLALQPTWGLGATGGHARSSQF